MLIAHFSFLISDAAAIREGMDVCFQNYVTGKVSLVPALQEQPPERVLDLGCGVRGSCLG